MKNSLKSLTALLLVGIFASTSVLAAPPDHRYDRSRPATKRHVPPPPPRRAPPPRRHHYTPPPPPPVQASHRHYDRPWRVGRSLPRTVTYYEVVPQRYKLAPPPRGHRYVRVGDDILLMAIGTGIIANAIYNIAH